MRKLGAKEIKRMSIKIGTTVYGLLNTIPDVMCIKLLDHVLTWASISSESITKKKTREILNKKEPKIYSKTFIYFFHGVIYPIVSQIPPPHHLFPSIHPFSQVFPCLLPPVILIGNKGSFSSHLSGMEALGPSDFSEWNYHQGNPFLVNADWFSSQPWDLPFNISEQRASLSGSHAAKPEATGTWGFPFLETCLLSFPFLCSLL